MNTYHAKLISRAERLEARAAKLSRAAEAVYRAGRAHVEHIPLGQPILVGHHSERRHRRALDRYDRAIRKSVELDKAAKRAQAAANRVGSGGISADDPEAVMKLHAKAEALQVAQERMKAANAAIRKHTKAGADAQRAALVALGFSERAAGELLAPDFCRRIGFPSYALQNNLANIKRIEQRIAQLERVAALVPTIEPTRWQIGADQCDVEANGEANRLQLFFAGKPSDATRSKLKSCGWRWSPTAGAWQRHLHTANVKWERERLAAVVVPAANS